MYCPKCKKEINNGKKFCDVCGSRLLDSENIESNIIIETSSSTNVIDNISLVEAYVGNYESFRNTNFNIFYLLFGPFYALYRKLYSLGFGLIIFRIILLLFDIKLYVILSLVLDIAISLMFNNMYLRHVSKKVETIKRNLLGKSRDEVLRYCRSVGGTSILLPILLYIIFSMFISYLITTKYRELYESYFGKLDFNTPVYKELSFTLPSELKKENDLLYSYDDDTDSCSYEISLIETSKTPTNYLITKSTYTERDQKSTVEEITINENEWYLMTIKTTSSYTYYEYATTHNHVLYNVTYKIYKDTGKCSTIKNELVNTLSFKE